LLNSSNKEKSKNKPVGKEKSIPKSSSQIKMDIFQNIELIKIRINELREYYNKLNIKLSVSNIL